MTFIGHTTRKTASGYITQSGCYQAQRCEGCPLRGQCTKAKGNRIIEVNHRLLEYKRKAREKLMSEQGLEYRSKRPIEPEAVFGQMKYNMAYRRFRHFGIEKVSMDFAFFAIAFNIKKMCANMAKMLSELKNMAANSLYLSKNHVLLSIRRIENLNLPKIAA